MMINHLIQPFLVDYYFYKLLQSTNILIWFLLGVYKQTLITIVICVSFQVYSLIIWINLSLDGNWSLRLWLFVACMVLVMWPTWGEKKIWFVTLMTLLYDCCCFLIIWYWYGFVIHLLAAFSINFEVSAEQWLTQLLLKGLQIAVCLAYLSSWWVSWSRVFLASLLHSKAFSQRKLR